MSCCKEDKRRSRHGFTLVELLVAMAASSILLLMLSTFFSAASGTSHEQSRLIENYVKARAAADAMARDLKSGLFRSDLAAFKNADGADAFCLYTARPGTGTSVRNTSLVLYRVDPATAILQRGALPIRWDDDPNFFSFNVTDKLPRAADVVPEDAAEGVVRMGIYFFGADGKLSKTYTPGKSTAMEITLAVIDGEAMKVLAPSQLARLTATDGALPDDSNDPPTQTLGTFWTGRMATPGFFNGYPHQLRNGLLVFDRCVEFPN